MKRVIALLMAAVMMTGLAACGSKEEPAQAPVETPAETEAPEETQEPAEAAGDVQSLKIGVSIMELTAYTWFQGVIDGCNNWMADHGSEYGVNMEFDFEDSRSDVQTMLDNVGNMISAKCDGIILFPADASSAIPTMKEATAEDRKSTRLNSSHSN